MDKKSNNVYLDFKSPGNFGGVKRLKQAVKSSSAKDIQHFLSTQNTYTLHKQRYGKFQRRKVTAPCRNYLFQADLIFMQKYKHSNKKYQYLLSVIDVFSRYGYCIPLKNKTADEIIRGFTQILSEKRRKPKFLSCDEGKEFFNVKFKQFLEKFNIKLYHNFSPFKACVVERFNRTILNRISKYFTFTGKKEYISILPSILQSYNSSVHRSIGRKPCDVNKYNEMDTWLYMNREMCEAKYSKPRLKLYDRVRICKKRGIFQKGYAPSYSSKVFEIHEIVKSFPPTFRIRDLHGNELRGIFYEKELVKVNIS